MSVAVCGGRASRLYFDISSTDGVSLGASHIPGTTLNMVMTHFERSLGP